MRFIYRYLERTRTEIEHYQQRVYPAKFTLQNDMAKRLRQIESELQNHMSLICVSRLDLVPQILSWVTDKQTWFWTL